MECPKLRPVQFFPVVVEGKRMGCLHDPQRISNKPLLIPWHLATILPYLDGSHGLLDIQAEYTRQCGDLLFSDDLKEFLNKLDHYLFLDTERFREFEHRIKEKFLISTVRPAFFSGLSYPSDPRVLLEELQGYFTCPEGSGWPERVITTKGVTGLVAPHIDLKSGGACYTWAYSELIHASILPELFIILGTCHTQVAGLFALTDKSFQTPLGIVECDKKFMELLQKKCNTDIFSEQFLHRCEHTIEFQILFLQFLWEKLCIDRPPLHVCPILCGFTPDCLSEALPDYNSFIEALKHVISLYDKSVCIIASVDLSHIGPKFGDTQAFDHPGREACFREDRIMLDIIAQQDQKGFQSYMMKSYDDRRICGYPPLTTLLDILPPSQGRLLNYDHSLVDERGSIVTYASMVFNREDI